jgi:8-oxo-dGTP pyrophosphatase MutT (NUDIX family)
VEPELIYDVARAIAAVSDRHDPGLDSWWEASADPKAFERSGAPSHFTASALPITADGTRVCLVLHGRMGLWVQPGGHLEAGDRSVREAAQRELAEETGLVGSISAEPLCLSRHPAPCGQADWHLDLQMLAVVPQVVPVLSEESTDVAWFEARRLPSGIASGVDALVGHAVDRVSRIGSRLPAGPRV